MNVEKIIRYPGLPIQGSDVAVAWDLLYWFLIGISVFFFILVVGGMIYFAIKYRAGAGHKTKYIVDNHALEAFWTVVPTVLLLMIFGWGWHVYTMMVRAPADAMEIRVVGKQWLWNFQYEDGRVFTNELFVPVNKPVKLVMSSEDVLHSFFIPAFRVKSDVVPGMYTSVWFEAKHVGEHQVFCTEYCGASHSLMLAKINVLEPEKWEAFRRGKKVDVTPMNLSVNDARSTQLIPTADASATTTATGTTPALALVSLPEQGKRIVEQKGCMACHKVDGPNQPGQLGPSYRGVYGHETELADGSKVKVDDDYLRESILKPTAKIVKGFNPVMPPFQGQINEQDLNAIIAYIKSLK